MLKMMFFGRKSAKRYPNIRLDILKADEIVRVRPCIAEHHEDEWVLQIVHSTVI